MTTKLTKTELRSQQVRLSQFQKYLPTLQLKKAMLQFEVSLAQAECEDLMKQMKEAHGKVQAFSPLLIEQVTINLVKLAEVVRVHKTYENIAGVEIPQFESVLFQEVEYDLFETPPWTESVAKDLRDLITLREKLSIAEEKKRSLEKELRSVSIRVNLFEKILIPRSEANIKKIRIFLGDQQLAAVAQAKVAKKKILEKREFG